MCRGRGDFGWFNYLGQIANYRRVKINPECVLKYTWAGVNITHLLVPRQPQQRLESKEVERPQRNHTVNPHVCTLLKRLMDFQCLS